MIASPSSLLVGAGMCDDFEGFLCPASARLRRLKFHKMSTIWSPNGHGKKRHICADKSTTYPKSLFQRCDSSFGHISVLGSFLNKNVNKLNSICLKKTTLTIAAICSTLAAASCACAAHIIASCSHLEHNEQEAGLHHMSTLAAPAPVLLRQRLF